MLSNQDKHGGIEIRVIVTKQCHFARLVDWNEPKICIRKIAKRDLHDFSSRLWHVTVLRYLLGCKVSRQLNDAILADICCMQTFWATIVALRLLNNF